ELIVSDVLNEVIPKCFYRESRNAGTERLPIKVLAMTTPKKILFLTALSLQLTAMFNKEKPKVDSLGYGEWV
ncbi:hypothetical protein BCU93_18435, partial [Vibrio breoganii]|uniref:hypothetical protein n=3 Tax=Vibrio breoganii TaxID=553239 RepID=UPI000C81866C